MNSYILFCKQVPLMANSVFIIKLIDTQVPFVVNNVYFHEFSFSYQAFN